MKKSTFSPSQIVKILKEFSDGSSAVELSRKYGISQGTLYSWRKKYGGMEAMNALRGFKHTTKVFSGAVEASAFMN